VIHHALVLGGVKAQVYLIRGRPGGHRRAADIAEQRQMVKVQNMRLQQIGAKDQVAHDARVFGYPLPRSRFQRQAGGHGMRCGAYPADPLGHLRCIAGILALQNVLESAVEKAAAPCREHMPTFGLHFHLQVAFQPRGGI